MLLRAFLCGGARNGFLIGKAKKEEVPCWFFGQRDGDGHLFWECTFHPSSMLGNFLSSLLLCHLIAANGPGVFFGMGGCLDLVVLVTVSLGLPLLEIQHAVILDVAWVPIRLTLLVGLLLTIGMLMILPWRCRSILIFGLMVAGKISHL